MPSLSPSPAATSTPIPNSTRINVAVFLHGIGKAGDNANPSGTGNQTPLTPKRNVTVFVYDSSNNLVMSPSATLMYQSTTGNFTGTVDLGSSFTTGQYLLKIKVPTYLRARVPGIVSLTANQSKSISDTTIVAGDANSDNVLNILDYNLLLDCYSELNDPRNCDPAKKTATDLTDDGNVNQFDYNLFLRELSVQSGE